MNENGNYVTDRDGKSTMVFETDQQALDFLNGTDSVRPDYPVYHKEGYNDGFYDSYYDDARGADLTYEFEKEYIE